MQILFDMWSQWSRTTAPEKVTHLLEGGVTISDRTNGIATATFSKEHSKKNHPVYSVSIQNKKLISPTFLNVAKEQFYFSNSIKIQLKKENGFIRIKERDTQAILTLYVDPDKPVENMAYVVYPYMPQEVKLTQANQKILKLKAQAPHFKGYVALYNRHGIGVFGLENEKGRYGEEYALYYARPNEQTLQKIKCSVCERGDRNKEKFFADSEDGYISFLHLGVYTPLGDGRYAFVTLGDSYFPFIKGKNNYLNREPAHCIFLERK